MLKKVNLEGKRALITGAGGGIGRAIALRLAEDGMKLALTGRDYSKLVRTAALTGRPLDMLVLPADLTKQKDVDDIFHILGGHFKGLDVLVNNAGMALNKPFEETTMDEYDRIMAINARAPFELCKRSLPLLRQSECPTIVNIGSVVAHKGYMQQSAYAASKHALLGMTKALAKEVAPEGIRVHMLSPGGVYTDMVKIARPDLSEEGMIAPEEVAELAAWLIEHRSNGVIDEIQLHRVGKEPFL
ncbi:MAG: SDR family oxidoreductase [Clostridia bacterium]|nr:SDR family oxidoreductase [Clostridia bacterium]